MRQGWVIGILSFYILIWCVILMTTSVAIGSDNVLDIYNELFSVGQVTSVASGVLVGASILTGVSNFFTALVSVVTLWFPVAGGSVIPLVSPSRIWTGNLIWVWIFPVSEIAIGMIVSIVTVLRGVGSN